MRWLVALLLLAACETASPPGPPSLDGTLPPRPLEASCRFEGQPPGVLPELSLTEVDVSGLELGSPLAMAPAPDQSGDVLLLEADGRLSRLTAPDETTTGAVVGAIDEALAFDTSPSHPGKVFVARRTSNAVRISRFDLAPAGIEPASEVVVIETAGAHGAALSFDDEGLLYVALGDVATTADEPSAAGNAATPEGTVRRLDVSSLDVTGTFSIPADNPTGAQIGLTDPAPVAAWATGLREPRACAFGAGLLWCVDQGVSVGEVHHVGATRDLGWPKYDGIVCLEKGDCTLELERLPQAVVPRPDPGCGMLPGAQIYAGSRSPSLGALLVYGSRCDESLHGMILDAPDGQLQSGALLSVPGLSGLGRDAAGEIFALAPARLLRIGAKNEGRSFPDKLSESGCFGADGSPRPGVVPYDVNAALWSDGSSKDRFLELPPETAIDIDDGELVFPEGTVVIKRFAYAVAGHGTVPVETRVMIRRQHGWEGHSYRWDEEGSDATLLDDSDSRLMELEDGSSLRHDFPDRYACRVCHGTDEIRLLGPRLDQLNRVVEYDDGFAQQLDAMSAIGFFTEPVASAGAPKMADYHDASLPVEARARAYLHTNCGHCHRPGGWVSPGLAMDLRHDTPASEMDVCDVPTQSGSAGFRLVPGDPEGSRLYQRMGARDFSQMPPLATTRTDPVGLGVIHSWIAAMSGCP